MWNQLLEGQTSSATFWPVVPRSCCLAVRSMVILWGPIYCSDGSAWSYHHWETDRIRTKLCGAHMNGVWGKEGREVGGGGTKRAATLAKTSLNILSARTHSGHVGWLGWVGGQRECKKLILQFCGMLFRKKREEERKKEESSFTNFLPSFLLFPSVYLFVASACSPRPVAQGKRRMDGWMGLHGWVLDNTVWPDWSGTEFLAK